MTSGGRLRDRRVLEQQVVELRRREHRGRRGRRTGPVGFRDGALAALCWLTDAGPAPLSGCLDCPPLSRAAVVRELAGADAVIQGRPSPQREYCRGVEHALMWASGALPEPPSDLVGNGSSARV